MPRTSRLREIEKIPQWHNGCRRVGTSAWKLWLRLRVRFRARLYFAAGEYYVTQLLNKIFSNFEASHNKR